jgi:D-alanyl-D-alanine carboxypeptidase
VVGRPCGSLPDPLSSPPRRSRAAAILAACGGSHHDAPRPAAAQRPTLAAQLHDVVTAGSPGVIAYVNDGHGLTLSADGVADTETGRAMRLTDRFRAGSNTGRSSRLSRLELVAEGKLSLDDTVERWLPGVFPTPKGV